MKRTIFGSMFKDKKHQVKMKHYLIFSFSILLFLSSCEIEETTIPLFGQKAIHGFCESGDCYNGVATFRAKDNSIYEGELRDGVMNGQGKLTLEDGTYWEGEWESGRFVEGRNYDSYEEATYEGTFTILEETGGDYSNVEFILDGEGKVADNNGKIQLGSWAGGELLLMENETYIPSHSKFRSASYRPRRVLDYKKKPNFDHKINRPFGEPRFSCKVNMIGREGKYGVTGKRRERLYGRLLRAWRLKNVTDEIEKRYGLPDGVLMAMVIQETGGVINLPNAQNDGGIGMSHMQGIVANDFGLRTVCHRSCGIRCLRHGRYLKQQINENHNNFKTLTKIDDRFNILLNLDAAARILAYYQKAGKNNKYKGIEKGILYYAGRTNFKKYWRNVKYYMSKLNSKRTRRGVAKLFNQKNSCISFEAYLNRYHRWNDNFGLPFYKNMDETTPYIPTPSPKPKPSPVRVRSKSKHLPITQDCYIVNIYSTKDKAEAQRIVQQFRQEGYRLADYFYWQDYLPTAKAGYYCVYVHVIPTAYDKAKALKFSKRLRDRFIWMYRDYEGALVRAVSGVENI